MISDEILLVEKYTHQDPMQEKILDPPNAPDEQKIIAATKHLEAKNAKNIPLPEDCLDNVCIEYICSLFKLVNFVNII